jgi:hypothetical protein
MSDDFKVGDIVSCGRSGWWRVKGLDSINKNKILLEMVMDSKGNVSNNKRPKIFNAFKNWCHKLTVNNIKKNKEQDCLRWDTLLFIVDPTQNIGDEVIKKIQVLDKPEPEYLIKLGPPKSLYKK